jgi:hypothetical protein
MEEGDEGKDAAPDLHPPGEEGGEVKEGEEAAEAEKIAESEQERLEAADPSRKVVLRHRSHGPPVSLGNVQEDEDDGVVEEEEKKESEPIEEAESAPARPKAANFATSEPSSKTGEASLPPAQPPPGWNRARPINTFSPPGEQRAYMPYDNTQGDMVSNNSHFHSNAMPGLHTSPIKRSPPRYYGSMYSYTSPNASRYSTLLREGQGAAGKREAGETVKDVEAYQEQRLISQELAKLRAEVADLKLEVDRQKQKRREIKSSLKTSKQRQLELEALSKHTSSNDFQLKREISRLKDVSTDRRNRIQGLQENLTATQLELREVKSKAWELEKDATAQKRMAESTGSKLSVVQGRLEEIRGQNRSLLQEKEALTDERDELRGKTESLQQDLKRAGELEAEMRKEAEAQREKIGRLTLEAESRDDGANGSAGGKIDSGSGDVGADDSASLNRKIIEQNMEIEKLKSQLSETEEKSNRRKEKASTSKAKLEQTKNELAVAERERQALLAREASSAHYIKQIERDLANFEHQCNVMNDAVMTCQAREASHVREVNKLRGEAEDSRKKSDGYLEEMKLKDEKLQNAETARGMAEQQHAQEKNMHAKLAAKHEKLEATLEEIKEKYEGHSLTEARMSERHDVMKQALRAKEMEMETKQRELENARIAIARLQADLQHAQTFASARQIAMTASPSLPQATPPSKEKVAEEALPPKSEVNSAPKIKKKDKKMSSKAIKNVKQALKKKKKSRPDTPEVDDEQDSSARLAAMKFQLKAELAKQTQQIKQKKEKRPPMDFLGLGYKTKVGNKAKKVHANKQESSEDED